MGEIKFIGGLLLIALFSIAIITYVSNFGDDNNAVVNLADEEDFETLNANINSNAETFAIVDTNSSSESFFESTLESGDDVMTSGGAFKNFGFRSLLSSITSIGNLARTYLFGGNTAFGIFITAISGILVYTGIRYIYKTWVGKNPD